MVERMIFFLKKILQKFGVNKAIFYTSIEKITRSFGGIITVFLISFFMSEEEQGFYFTFSSVLALQIFFELGLGGILSQFVAHEMAKLSFYSPIQLEGELRNLSRLSSLLNMFFKWYLVFSGLLFLTLSSVGYLFFSKYGVNYGDVEWKTPWLFIVVTASLNLLISPLIAVLNGMNKVKEMARISFIKQLFVMLTAWISLVLGAKLYVMGISSFVGFISIIFLLIRTEYPRLLINLFNQKINQKINYKKEIFPLQWKIALSWISGYFIFQLFNPIVFAFSGSVEAGKIGITLVLLNAILGFITSWTSTKIPIWSIFIANKDFLSLNNSFIKTLKDSTIVCLLSVILCIMILSIMDLLNLKLFERFLPTWVIAIFFITIPLNNIINIWATYLRCHKKEPFLIQSVIIGLICSISTFLTAKFIGVNGVVIAYTSIILLISTPLSYYIFNKKRKEYHV